MHLILIQFRNTRDFWAKPNLSRQIFFMDGPLKFKNGLAA